MANYYINIIDTTDNTHTTIVEKAAAASITLNYEGKDAKDDLTITGSALNFTMEVPQSNNIDGTFLHLFTGDETKYKVELRKELDSTLIWSGFILPDSYSEPYHSGTFYVAFTATDGLGRLKGKYLPDSFYEDENTVTDIICKCLELTGLELDLYLAPAIHNTSQKLWHTIYLDGRDFVDNNKKQDAYKILQTLMQDMLSTVFQTSNSWKIEGFNIRNLTTFTTQQYNYDGTYVGEVEQTRLIKNIMSFLRPTPMVTMVAPYNQITVTHERVAQELPETIATEANDGWIIGTGVMPFIYATDWNGNNGSYAYNYAPDYHLAIFGDGTAGGYIDLKEKVYFDAGAKVKITLKVDRDFMTYDVLFNSEIIFSNVNGDITDEEVLSGSTGNYEASLEFITQSEGLLDIKWYQPPSSGTGPDIYTIHPIYETKIEVIDFEEEQIITDTISDDYTIDKEIELTFADDKSGFSKAFQLAKLRTADTSYNTISVPIVYGFTQNDKNYAVVSLYGANLIKDNPNTVYRSASLITINEVIYNFNNGEEMVVETDTLYETGNFDVRVYKINDYTTTRAAWHEWTDAVYGIETERYAKIIANVMRRLFILPHQKVDVTVDAIIKPDDIVVFNYLQQSNYVVTNCNWNIDKGYSTLTIARAIYQNDDVITPGDNIPPIVDAGDDVYIDEGETTASLDATAFDPDGTIAAYLWQKLSGTNGAITTPFTEDTTLTNLTGDEYEFKITVTDNDGATGSDTVKVFRVKEYTITLTALGCTTPEPNTSTLVNKECTYRVDISPALPDDFTLQIEGDYEIESTNNDEQYLYSVANMKITKEHNSNVTTLVDETAYENETFNTPFTVNIINGNTVKFIGYLKVENEDPGLAAVPAIANANYTINITAATFINGFGTIAGLTQTATESIDL